MDMKANIRVIHASFDAPPVDVKVDGTTAISNLSYGISSGYAELDAGSKNIKVTPAGSATPVVIDANLVLEQDKKYTVIASGPLTSITPVVVEDNRQIIINKAKIRFAHMSPDAPAIDIKLNSGTGPIVFSNVAFRNVTEYIEVDGDFYTFVVTPANSTDEVIVFDPIAVQNEMLYTVVAKGTLNASDSFPFIARIFIDNGIGNAFVDLTNFGTAQVMLIHASPNAPAVDLYVDNGQTVYSLPFPAKAGYFEVSGGLRNFKVNVTGTSTSVIDANIDFIKNKIYSIFAVDSIAKIQTLLIEDDLSTPAAGNAHVRFIHLSPNAPAVDITTTTGAVVFGNKSFKEYTDFTPLAAGSYDLQVRLQGTDTVVLELPGINLQDGKIYTVFARGFAGGSGAQEINVEIIVNN